MTHLLVLLAILTAYGLFVLIKPDGPCHRCAGWGHRQKRRRRTACPRCQGTGRRFRPGARLVHKGAAAAVRAIREHRGAP